jgi:hypothetical protein
VTLVTVKFTRYWASQQFCQQRRPMYFTPDSRLPENQEKLIILP